MVSQARLGAHLLLTRLFLMVEHLCEGIDDHPAFAWKDRFNVAALATPMRQAAAPSRPMPGRWPPLSWPRSWLCEDAGTMGPLGAAPWPASAGRTAPAWGFSPPPGRGANASCGAGTEPLRFFPKSTRRSRLTVILVSCKANTSHKHVRMISSRRLTTAAGTLL
jgi:hypothetical protein